MKILCFKQFYLPNLGGMQISNKLLIEGLKAKNRQIELHLLGFDGKAKVEENLKIFKHRFLPSNFYGHLRTFILIMNLIKRTKPDLIIFLDESLIRVLGIYPFKLNFKSKIFSINSGSVLTRRNKHLKGKLHRFLIDRGFSYINKIFVSQLTYYQLFKNYPHLENKLKVLGRPITNDFFCTPKKNVNWLKKKNLPVIMSIGNLLSHKGFDLIVKSLAMIRDLYGEEKFEYLIIGDGKQSKYLNSLIVKNGLKKVSILGYRKNHEIPNILKKADIFLVPSLEEGETFGRSCVEAMASGKPILASSLGNLKNLVKNGINGYLVEPNAENFFKALNNFLKIDGLTYFSMSKNSYEIAKNYRQKNIIKKIFLDSNF